MNFFKNLMAAFSKDESGAVTVDFVVLTAAVVVIGGTAIATITTKIEAAASAISM